MTPAVFNITLAFTFSFLGSLIFRSHLISTLLYVEVVILSLFILATITPLKKHSMIIFKKHIVILVFAACKATVGLATSAKISNTDGYDFMHKLNILHR